MSVVGLRTVLRYNHLGPLYEWYFRYSPVLQDNINLLQWRCIIDVMAEEVNSYLYCSTWFVGPGASLPSTFKAEQYCLGGPTESSKQGYRASNQYSVDFCLKEI